MRLTRVRATDFEAYADLDLEFTASPVVIVGPNNHGKSAILDVITWALYGRVRRMLEGVGVDDLIRRGSTGMRAEVEFDCVAGHVRVVREKPRGSTGTLSLEVDGEQRTAHTIADTMRLIASLVGMRLEALLAGPFMAQEEAGNFMKAGASQRKDLVLELLGLTAYEPLHEAAKTKRQEVTADLSATEAQLARLEPVIARKAEVGELLESARSRLASGMEAQALASDRLQGARVKMAEAQVRIDRHAALETREHEAAQRLARSRSGLLAATARREGASAVLDAPEPTYEGHLTIDPAELAEAKREEAELGEGRTKLAEDRARRVGLERDLNRLTGEKAEHEERIKTVPCGGEGIYAACPLLLRGFDPGTIEEARVQLALVDERMTSLTAYVESRAGVSSKREVLEAHVREAAVATERNAGKRRMWQSQRDAAATAMEQAREEESRLHDTITATIHEQEQLAAERAEIESSFEAIKAAEAEIASATEAHRAAAAVVHDAEPIEKALAAEWERIKVAEADQATLGMQAGRYRAQEGSLALLVKAWHRDGIPSSLLEAELPLIENAANDVLARLPEDLAISIRTQRERKTGGMADALDVVVIVRGEESPYYLLSVGARFRIDLAIRIGIARLLGNRTGATIDTLWLDEPLAALDAQGRERAVDLLASLADDFGLIVVVSHHPDMNDRFPARVDVSQEDGISTAVQL